MSKVLNMSSLLEEHYKYLKGIGGKRLSLSGHDLSNADLSDANLSDADLSSANLRNADLSNADLSSANLSDADLSDADLSSANLSSANLSSANLRYANLRYANLRYADLKYADLSNTNLRNADLSNADLRSANLPAFSIVPTKDDFIAYKKLSGGVVVEVLIIGDRTNSLIGRKCRTSKLKVLKVVDNPKSVLLDSPKTAIKSTHYGDAVYYVGAVIEEPKYNGDIRVECTEGIHFFLTYEEAKAW